MQRVVYSLLLVTAVVACSTNDSRYKDISHLEQPPTLPSNPSGESYAVDDSRIERTRASQGLSSTVYLVEDKPLQIRIKMPIDKAWYALAQAIKQSGMKVTDYDRGKKVYYVQYGEAQTGLLESFLMESPKVNYILALKEYNKEHVMPRILPKTANIQYHYYNSDKPGTINVNGNGGEIARCYYGYTNRKITLEMLLLFSGYPSSIEFVRQELDCWFVDASQFAEEHKIPLLDLFYWEQRMGNWGALYPFEQDIAIEEISPFNNKSLLYALLRVKASKRRSPDYKFIRKLIQNLWPDTLSEPINPDKTILNSIINRNSYWRYYLEKGKLFLKMLKAKIHLKACK